MTDNNHLSEQVLRRMERLGKIGHWRWDVQDNSLFWSEGVYQIHGIDSDGFTPNVDAALDAYIHDDRADVEECLTNAIENNEDFKFEKRIKRPDGEIRHVISQGECEFDDNNELLSVFGVIQDITPIKMQEELYELAALGSSSALWDWDVTHDRLHWAGRSAEIMGYASNKQLPQTTEDFYEGFLHPDDKEIVSEGLINHFTKLDEFWVRIRIKRNDGSYEWFSSRAQAQFDDYGKAIRVCGSMTSIQNLKEAQEKLEQSNSDLENFASIAAHELKRPLRTVASYLQLIGMSKEEMPASVKDHMEECIKAADEMSFMVDELLEYAQLQDAELNISAVNLDQITKAITRSAKDEVNASKAHIGFGDLPTIPCDETKIKTVITNLLHNAIKYRSDEKPEIHMSAAEHDEHWQYTIKDNGLGIPEGQGKTIFDMFKRLDNAKDRQGTGIGLAICRRIVDLHKGKIWVEPNDGQGSIFHFTISKRLSYGDNRDG